MIRTVGLSLFLFACGSPAAAQLPGIELGSLSRGGGQIGSTFELQVASGARFDDVDSLWFSDPSIRAELLPSTVEAEPESANQSPRRFRVTLPSELAAGRYEVRLVGRRGVSNPRIFLATEHPWSVSPTIGRGPDDATVFDFGSVFAARAEAEQVDWFVVDMAADELVSFQLQAQSLGSALIGQLTLLDSNGRRLQSARGADDFDPSLSFVPTAAGRYFVCVHDVLFRGGPEYAFLLHGTLGEVEEAEPLAWSADATAIDTAGLQVPAPHRPEAVGIVAPPTDVPVTSKQAAIVTSKQVAISTPLTLPQTIVGRFNPGGEPDRFEFSAEVGERLQIDVTSQRSGEPSDPFWWVEREERSEEGATRWERVQTADDSQEVGDAAVRLRSADPVGIFAAAKGGRHRLLLRDLDTGQSLKQEKAYRLFIGPPQPDFQLVAYQPYPHLDANQSQSQPHGSMLLPGGTEAIRVFVLRQAGWAGEVSLHIEGLPERVHAAPAVLAANQTTTQLTMVAEEDAVGVLFEPRVIGRAWIDDQEVMREARAATIDWGRGGGRDFIRSRLSTRLVAATTSTDPIPLSLELGEPGVAEIKRDGTLAVPIRLIRRDGGQAACIIRPRDLPAGITAAEVTIPAEQTEGVIELKVGGGSVAGTYSIWCQVETKLKLDGKELTVFLPTPNVTIRVTDAS